MATINEVNDKLDKIADSLGKLVEVLQAPSVPRVLPSATPTVQVPPPPVAPAAVVTPPLPDTPFKDYPIPVQYRECVDNVLNKDFGIRIEPLPDSPAFMFVIVVPEKYSSMTPEQRALQGADIRPKVTSYADGTNGVRLWCEKVYNNFNPDMRAKIMAERTQL